MDLETINNKAFNLFLTKKKKKIMKSINIDNKLTGNKLGIDEYIVKTKAIQLWNIMTEEKQQKYINKIKDNLDVSYDFTYTK